MPSPSDDEPPALPRRRLNPAAYQDDEPSSSPPSQHHHHHPHRHHEAWRTLRWVASLAAVLAVAWLAIRTVEHTTGRAASSLTQGLDKVLGAITSTNTRIVEGRAEIDSSAPVSELTLQEVKMTATRSFESENYVLKYLPAGTKQLIVRGNYRVTAGYKLKPGVSLRIEDGVPVARFPKPAILSVELIDFQILSEKDGWANSVNAEDRAQVMRELRQQMRIEAQKSGVLDMVDSALRTRLQDLLGVKDVRIEREVKEDAAAPDKEGQAKVGP